MKILVIDQDAETAEKLNEMIHDIGYETLAPSRQGTCLMRLADDHKKCNPDVVFVDMDSTALSLRRLIILILQDNPRAKIILTTRDAREFDPSSVGALGVFHKPLRVDSLRPLLHQVETVYFSDTKPLKRLTPRKPTGSWLKRMSEEATSSARGSAKIVAMEIIALACLVIFGLRIGF